ncbi:hypothetical protein SKAU_G00385860 [Synaphobranchus kaupii]|uniref:Alkylated DNA repair protein AlkB homologue 8 N-terminal domain-containing protein n=1 Tax=Synaphobranchus kaupii TaxID=118154 RepID=A0A9Q1IF87_SYNKA|nr:hypothetical protein SKAU_G00385860 [Synaphobranchus kaupii]
MNRHLANHGAHLTHFVQDALQSLLDVFQIHIQAASFPLYSSPCTQTAAPLVYTTLIGLISDGDESAYRWEIDHLVSWCGQNNLELNALKTVEMVVDFRKNPAPPAPITLSDSPVETVVSFRFLGTIITQDFKWEQNISSLTKEAQQRMYFLQQLKKFNLPKPMMCSTERFSRSFLPAAIRLFNASPDWLDTMDLSECFCKQF